MFNSIIENGVLTINNVIICLISSLLLGLIIAFVCMKTSKCSKNFIITLSILPLLVSVVLIMVNGNLGTSVAVLGAFSLIRFRSIAGNSSQIVNVFWAMAIGLSIGMGQIYFAIIITLFVGVILIIFNKIKFGEINNNERILKILIPEDLDYENVFDKILKDNTKNYTLLKVETKNMGSLFELKYSIILKDKVKDQEFINSLRVRNGNLKVNISHPLYDELL